MKEALSQLIQSVDTDTPLAPDVADALLRRYPYLSAAASRALLDPSLSPEQRQRYLQRVALNAPDVASLMALVDPQGALFATFYPPKEQPSTPTTTDALDTFLDTYGGGVNPREEALLERLIFNPTPDYSEVLAREAEASPAPTATAEPASEQDALLDAFLQSQAAAAAHPEPEPEPQPEPQAQHLPKPNAADPLSESLAKIFIKRGRYDKAYEIIRQLSLNFPEKSVYFADQLRFLRKLMLNQQYAKAKKS
ncbi:MAG: hypothetical protein NC338_01210 [Firmicutes bacterium]|nr:hypothetical protein [Bacillota bacterium]MCM1401690.1 hypothetical protein [Bacteroides sp.]MCM1477498.1 hypothetical protein [Bacteroides sp.]